MLQVAISNIQDRLFSSFDSFPNETSVLFLIYANTKNLITIPYILKFKFSIDSFPAISVDPDKRYDTISGMINRLSGVDENLDWRYNIVNDIESCWSKLNEKCTHEDCIIIEKWE